MKNTWSKWHGLFPKYPCIPKLKQQLRNDTHDSGMQPLHLVNDQPCALQDAPDHQMCHTVDTLDGRGAECHTLLAQRVGQVGDGVFLADGFGTHHRHAELGWECVYDCQLHVCRLKVEYKRIMTSQILLPILHVDLINTNHAAILADPLF